MYTLTNCIFLFMFYLTSSFDSYLCIYSNNHHKPMRELSLPLSNNHNSNYTFSTNISILRNYYIQINSLRGEQSWYWSYGSCIYNYLCNQCLSPLTLWVRSGQGVQHYVIKFVNDLRRLVVFSGTSGFLHQYNWPPRYNWTIVENGSAKCITFTDCVLSKH
jgi:hypothetical protein